MPSTARTSAALPISPPCPLAWQLPGSFRRSWLLGTVTATLVVDNQVEVDTGTTYNVTGVLKGKSSDRQILVGGHYDVHFWGLQDDNCAVGLVLSMAKALVDSGY